MHGTDRLTQWYVETLRRLLWSPTYGTYEFYSLGAFILHLLWMIAFLVKSFRNNFMFEIVWKSALHYVSHIIIISSKSLCRKKTNLMRKYSVSSLIVHTHQVHSFDCLIEYIRHTSNFQTNLSKSSEKSTHINLLCFPSTKRTFLGVFKINTKLIKKNKY